jgi:hypothetical protein
MTVSLGAPVSDRRIATEGQPDSIKEPETI